MKLGVAFSGGGVRSAAQLGIMKYLYEQGIKPTIFTGTSGGAIVATMLALGAKPDDALKSFKTVGGIKDIAYWHIISRLLTGRPIEGLLKSDKLHKVLMEMFCHKWLFNINTGAGLSHRDERIGIVTTDINTGAQVIFTNALDLDVNKVNDDNIKVINNQGYHLSSIVLASCSIPTLLPPREFKDMLLVDGGITNNLPSDVAFALGADKVVSIDLGYSGKQGNVTGLQEIVTQSLNILIERGIDNNSRDYGIYLNPKIYNVKVLEIDKIDYCFEKGYDYAKENFEMIRRYLEM